MASRFQASSRFGRRIMWLAAAVIIAVLAYSAAWTALARALEGRIAATLAEVNGNGVRAFCEEPNAHGYPFRIGLSCRSVFYENVRSGISVRAGALRSTANIYQPFRVAGRIDAPATVILPMLVPLEVRWERLRASARLARPLPERFSAKGKNVEISAEEGGTAPLATLGAVEVHARQQASDVETALSFRNLRLGEEAAAGLPAIEGRALVLIDEGVAILEEGRFDPHGRSATIRELVVGVVGEEASFSASGPISLGEDGLLNADLSLSVKDPATMMRILAEIFPDMRDEINTASSVLSGLGDAPLQLRVVRGRAFLGFIPLGTIPPM